MKLFFYILRNFRLTKLYAGPHCANVFFRRKTKVIAFSCIVIPCFFNFPLIAFGQDGHNILDSRFVLTEAGSHIPLVEFSDSPSVGNLISESGFEFLDSRTNIVFSVSGSGKTMTDSLSDPVSKKRDYGNSNNSIKPSSGVTERIDEREQLFWFLCFVFIVVSNAILNGIISYYRDTQREIQGPALFAGPLECFVGNFFYAVPNSLCITGSNAAPRMNVNNENSRIIQGLFFAISNRPLMLSP